MSDLKWSGPSPACFPMTAVAEKTSHKVSYDFYVVSHLYLLMPSPMDFVALTAYNSDVFMVGSA